MRLTLVSDVESRDGAGNKDERLTNLLVEADESSVIAGLRPGLATISSNSGNGNGLTTLGGNLISVFGTTAGYGSTPTSIGTVENKKFDFAQGPT